MDEQRNDTYSPNEVDLTVLWHNFSHAARRFLWLVVLVALVVAAYAGYCAERSYVPNYCAEAVFSVHANYTDVTDLSGDSTYLNQSAARTLAATFPYVISGEYAQTLLKRELGVSSVNGSITAFSTASSALFTMQVTGPDAQDAYDILLAAIKIYPQAAGSVLGDTTIHVIVLPTQAPTEPCNSSGAVQRAMIFFCVVLLIGLALLLLLAMARKTVHSAEDLRRLFSLKCLAYIPSVRLKKHSRQSSLYLSISNPAISAAFSESIRSLSLKVRKQMGRGKVLLVTSTLPDEGKTTVATNLALSLSKAGKRTILIDGDLRKQSLKATLGIREPSEGLVEVLSGGSKSFHLIAVPNSKLVLLSGDKTVDRPLPLLDSPRFAQVIEMLREKLDYIIIDSPPAAFLADAATIAKYCDATLYVVRQDHANTAQIVDAVQSISASGSNLIGCVLNRTQAGTTRYGYGSKYGVRGYAYGYRYAASYGKNRRRSEEELAQDLGDILPHDDL